MSQKGGVADVINDYHLPYVYQVVPIHLTCFSAGTYLIASPTSFAI